MKIRDDIENLSLYSSGRLKNYYKDDNTYHDYNIGDLIMVADERQNGNRYIEVGQIINKSYDENYNCYQLTYIGISTGSCDYGVNTISGTIEEIDEKVYKHLPKYCIDKELEKEND